MQGFALGFTVLWLFGILLLIQIHGEFIETIPESGFYLVCLGNIVLRAGLGTKRYDFIGFRYG
jgi:hypothetical protein